MLFVFLFLIRQKSNEAFSCGKCMKWNKKKFAIKREQRQACSSLPGVSKLCKTAWAVTVGIILCGCLLFWPTSERACREGVAEAVTVSWYELGVPGGDTLYFNVLRTDSTLGELSTEREIAQREFRANAFDQATAKVFLDTIDGGRHDFLKGLHDELLAVLAVYLPVAFAQQHTPHRYF